MERKGCVLHLGDDREDYRDKIERFAVLCFLLFVLHYLNMQSHKYWLGFSFVKQAIANFERSEG
jgi:hypothetical protein